MKKGLIAVVLVAVLAAGGAGGYTVYQKKVAEKKYEQDMTKTISSRLSRYTKKKTSPP